MKLYVWQQEENDERAGESSGCAEKVNRQESVCAAENEEGCYPLVFAVVWPKVFHLTSRLVCQVHNGPYRQELTPQKPTTRKAASLCEQSRKPTVLA